jgi:hypothetical protein
MIQYTITRLDRYGADWKQNHGGSWVVRVEARDTTDAIQTAGHQWEGETLGLLDFPVYMRVDYADMNETNGVFQLDHVVTHEYPVRKLA